MYFVPYLFIVFVSPGAKVGVEAKVLSDLANKVRKCSASFSFGGGRRMQKYHVFTQQLYIAA